MLFFVDERGTYHNLGCVKKICPEFIGESLDHLYFSVKIEDSDVVWVNTKSTYLVDDGDEFGIIETFYKRFVCDLNDFQW